MRRTASAVPLDLQCHELRAGERTDGMAGEMVALSFSPSRRPRLTEAERDVALAVARVAPFDFT